jgi:hypothetical protein
METKILDNCTSFCFDSIDEAMNGEFRSNANFREWSVHANYSSWTGCTLAQMKQWLEKGWDGVEQLDDMLAKLEEMEVVPSSALLRKRRKVRGEQGDAIDVTRVWSGHTDTAWERMVRENQYSPSHKFVSIFINTSCPSSVRWQASLWRAAAVARIVQALQASGRAVRLTAGQISSATYVGEWGGKMSVHGVRVKDFAQPLSIMHLALACTSMFHRICVFRMMASCTDKTISSGFGRAESPRKVFPHTLREDELVRDAMLVRVDDCYSEAEARRVCDDVRQQLQRHAVDRYEENRNGNA